MPTTPQVSDPPGAAAGSAPSRPTAPPSASMRKSPNRNEQQLKYLLERQKEFKMAALQSKKRGDLEGAKNYLRMGKVGESKNFEKRRFAVVLWRSFEEHFVTLERSYLTAVVMLKLSRTEKRLRKSTLLSHCAFLCIPEFLLSYVTFVRIYLPQSVLRTPALK